MWREWNWVPIIMAAAIVFVIIGIILLGPDRRPCKKAVPNDNGYCPDSRHELEIQNNVAVCECRYKD